MSTEGGPRPESEFEIISRRSAPTTLDETAAALELQLQRERDQRNEERFIWIFVTSLLALPLVTDDLDTTSSFVFFPCYIAFLIAAAKWLGVDAVVITLERIMSILLRRP